ncbi:MarR family winged helix-turn-helix transcriptional regulator [Psychromicrobium sp. YIM B11713]|uniref:MarR family winged helix-turn-helix transcriptional regulator n=1 Tax=Psychromicrobium sp. YIM B11713 TaxID=3145233 RepID=UPI00374F4FE7
MSQSGNRVNLRSSVGYTLKQATSSLRSAMDAVLRPLGMTVSQYSCLEHLAQRPGLSNSELARGTFVSRQSMNVLLQALERDGLITRPEAAPVGRALPAQLTALGRKKLTAASRAVKSVEDRMLRDLDATEQESLMSLLTSCIAALSEPMSAS